MHRSLKLGLLRGLLAPAVIFWYAASATATTAIVPADRDMVISARAIVIGKVLDTSCGLPQGANMVYTYVRMRVQEVLKGSISTREIVLKEPGGRVGTQISMIYGSPQFTRGDRVLLYLDTWFDGSLRVHQMFLGKFNVVVDKTSGKTFVQRDAAGAHVELLGNGSDSPDGAATSRMELGPYVKMVKRLLNENAEQSREFLAAHYSGIEILSEPNGYRALAARGGLQAQFHVFPTPFRWFEPDSGQPVTLSINPDQAPSPDITSDVIAAMNAWSNLPGCSLRIVSGGTTSSCLQRGAGPSLIYFDDCDGRFSQSSGCSGLLGIGGISAGDGGNVKVVNGTSFVQITQSFVTINPAAACNFTGNECNLREVLTHEIGHAVGMAHSWDTTYPGTTPNATDLAATMYYIAHFDGRCAAIETDDINGIKFIYPGSSTGPEPLAVATTSLPEGRVGQVYSQTLAATGGTAPYNWSLAPGSGALPAGLTLGADGTVSGTPSATGTFGFTAEVTDSASPSNTAQAQLSITISNPSSGGQYDAQFVSQSVPNSVQPGQTFQVTLVLINSGVAPWTESTEVRIGSQNPANNTTWGGNRVILPGSIVINSGVEVQIPFAVTAPLKAGIYNFQWQMVQDSGAGFFGDLTPNVAITVGQPAPTLAIVTTSLPAAPLNTAYIQPLSATGGTKPYTWAVATGSLPPGLSLDPALGAISGSPTAAGAYPFIIQVSDTSADAAQASLSITVPAPPLTIGAVPMPLLVVQQAVRIQMTASGGVPPYFWSISEGSLPNGLALDSGAGLISGTPTTKGTFGFAVTVADSKLTQMTTIINARVVTPDEIPLIQRVKYRSGPQKLIVAGMNFDVGATVNIDGAAWATRNPGGGMLTVKAVPLASGSHSIVVVNSTGIASAAITISVP